jgi:replicative DNA helicase
MTLSNKAGTRSLTEAQPLPHNKELEYTIIGTSLVDKVVLSMAIEQLREDDFYFERCKDLFKIMKDMVQSKIPVDLITLDARLVTVRREELRELVDDVSSNIGTIENCEGYIELLAQEGIKRRLIVVSNEIQRMCYDFDVEFDKITDESEKLIQGAIVREMKSKGSNMTEVMSKTMDHLQKIHMGTQYGIPTGFAKLDELLGSYEPSQVIIVAGRASQGKTSFVTATALNLAIFNKIPVAFFSLETSEVQLGQRILSQWGGVNLLLLRKGILRKQDSARIMEKAGEIADAPIYIDDESLLTLGQFRSKLRKMISKFGIKLAIVDYLQLMGHSERDQNQGIAKITRGMKITAKEFGIPIMLLSQLSRANEKRGGKKMKPMLSDLRDSGAIEQDADVVLFVHRPYYYDKEKEDPTVAEIIIGKQKNGPTETVPLHFQSDCAMFFNDAPECW